VELAARVQDQKFGGGRFERWDSYNFMMAQSKRFFF